MPFEKFITLHKREMCRDREHNPPSMIIVLEPGTHIWTCPKCGAKQSVFVAGNGGMMSISDKQPN